MKVPDIFSPALKDLLEKYLAKIDRGEKPTEDETDLVLTRLNDEIESVQQGSEDLDNVVVNLRGFIAQMQAIAESTDQKLDQASKNFHKSINEIEKTPPSV